ncbi:CLUMA_CG009183, isoform A [Clunio marinus]|uniref:CLUMA_CG009183, isoform A n=1 Tax=Clunio marinus TaxID=568069 RepID=A0A1J1I9T3_9DIPT|nr:CLUMA_CG009183, isoform A [Clunio marinus]
MAKELNKTELIDELNDIKECIEAILDSWNKKFSIKLLEDEFNRITLKPLDFNVFDVENFSQLVNGFESSFISNNTEQTKNHSLKFHKEEQIFFKGNSFNKKMVKAQKITNNSRFNESFSVNPFFKSKENKNENSQEHSYGTVLNSLFNESIDKLRKSVSSEMLLNSISTEDASSTTNFDDFIAGHFISSTPIPFEVEKNHLLTKEIDKQNFNHHEYNNTSFDVFLKDKKHLNDEKIVFSSTNPFAPSNMLSYDDGSIKETSATSECKLFGLLQNKEDNELIHSDGHETKFESCEMSSKEIDDSSNNSQTYITQIAKILNTLSIDSKFFLVNYPDVNSDPNLKINVRDIKGTEIKIYICEVYSLIQFWFHHGEEVIDLMERMNEDYYGRRLDERTLAISDANITPGLIVACEIISYGGWHRAKVINNVDENGFVRIFCLDYGTVLTVPKKDIKFLFLIYMDYPQYCYRGRITNIKPLDGNEIFEKNHVKNFTKKFTNKLLDAKVLNFDILKNVYELDLSLCDASGKNENLRNWIVKSGFGIYFNSSDKKDQVEYEPPSFSMLESNHPALEEQLDIQK